MRTLSLVKLVVLVVVYHVFLAWVVWSFLPELWILRMGAAAL